MSSVEDAIKRANSVKGNDGQAHALIAIAEAILYFAEVMRGEISSPKVVALDWAEARERIERLLQRSREVADILPHTNTMFYDQQLRALHQRYTNGERTKELYDAIMNFAE